MTKRYGIDLGTTYSTISRYDESRSEVKVLPLESEDGETSSLRSVIYYPPEGSPVVGEVAWNTRKQDPDRVVVGVKRRMGDDWTTTPINGVRMTPQQISAEILRTLKANAEIEMGEEVTDVVITVPAYFGERQCAATMEAAAAAGLHVINMLSEPHAAAVAYSIERATCLTDKHVLVYDLGGGTFDVCLIKPVMPEGSDRTDGVSNLTLNTICKDGNRELGGLDWDDALIDLVAEKCLEQFDSDPRLDNRNSAVLHDHCEKAKRALSKKTSEMVVADLAGHIVEVTRAEFEERTSGLLLQTRMRLEQVLAEASEQHGIQIEDVDVLMCGGATRMPMVKAMLQEVLGKQPLEYKNPQLLVSCGAAYVSHAMDPDATIPLPGAGGEACNEQAVAISPDSITDITCHAVGIQVIRRNADGEPKAVNVTVLEKGTMFGERREFVTETLFDDQTEVCIRLFEGDSEDPEECVHLMDFRIEGLPAERPRGRPIRTTLWFGANGIITGTAVDLETSHEINILYDRWSNLEAKVSQPSTPFASTPAPRAPAPSAPSASTPAPSVPASSAPVANAPAPSPAPEAPVANTPAPSAPASSAPVANAPAPSPAPEAPVANTPAPSAPTPEAPVASVPEPSAPAPAAPLAVTPEPSAPAPVVSASEPAESDADVSEPADSQPVHETLDAPDQPDPADAPVSTDDQDIPTHDLDLEPTGDSLEPAAVDSDTPVEAASTPNLPSNDSDNSLNTPIRIL